MMWFIRNLTRDTCVAANFYERAIFKEIAGGGQSPTILYLVPYRRYYAGNSTKNVILDSIVEANCSHMVLIGKA